MKTKTTRALCAFLASLMLVGTLAACADTGDQGGDTSQTEASSTAGTSAGTKPEPGNETNGETSAGSTAESDGESAGETSAGTDAADTSTTTDALVTETETDEPIYKDDIPAGTTFDGDEVIILSRYREGWTSGEIAVEALNTDMVNDTVYERNKEIEDRLDIKIVSIEEDNPDPFVTMQKVTTSVTAGTHEYDLVACACYVSINQSLSGTFLDLCSTEYLDLEKPWWAQGFNEAVEYQGSQYVATGSALLSMYRFAFVTVFNKVIFNDNSVPYLYEDVRNQTWTLDRQIELVQTFYRDNGNSVQDEEGDVYGLVTNDYISVDPYWSACDVPILGRDETGSYELIFDSARLFDVAEKTLKLFYDTGNAVYNYKHYGYDDEQVDIRDMFANDGAAMATLRILELENEAMRSMKSEYGVIPMPKYDDVQEDYRTLLHDQVTVLSIPASIEKEDGRSDMAGAVMEALASNSHYSLRPVYYETTLRTKIAQDPESAEMMDTIIDNVYIDAGILYTQAVGNFHDKFRQIMGSKVNTVTSDYKRVCAQVEKRQLPKMLESLDKLAEKNG